MATKQTSKKSNSERMAAVVEKLEELIGQGGQLPWTMPWQSVGGNVPRSGVTGKIYKGVNRWILGMIGEIYYPGQPNVWMTYKQISTEGGQVRKGEKSSEAILWKFLVVEEERDGKIEKKRIPMLRSFAVFHWTQAEWPTDDEGVPTEPREVRKARARRDEVLTTHHDLHSEGEETIKRYLDNGGPSFHRGGDRAFYRPLTDSVTVPTMAQFPKIEDYYLTTFHELAHSTGHESRLAREFGGTFGSDLYSREELVAEMSAAMLGAHVGVSNDGAIQQSAAYLQSWLRSLKDDPMALSWAAGRAEKAVALILGEIEEEGEESE